MSTHNDAIAMLRQAQAALNSPVPGDAAGLIANALRLLGDGADIAPDPTQAKLNTLASLVRVYLEAQRAHDLTQLRRDAAMRSLVVYVESLETAQ